MIDGQLLAFLGVAILLTVTPGADMALVTKHALASGPRAATWAALGIESGLVVWAILSAVGVAALVNASATAFTVLKLAGAAYLVALGLHTLWQARRHRPAEPANTPMLQRTTARRAYRQGLFSNLLNPKVGVFYTTFLPQFVAPGDAALAASLPLALVHVAIGAVWLLTYIRMVVVASDHLRRPRVRAWLDRATGAVLVALGVRLAFERR